eukprot:CAMPEP_0197298200 /NCGR_PEP_ID=MMETSP0890-20130614/42879_1 /TAXON_ID=44058 ORGANISM="Aureoumbra lagunensis, Strain CCMP1510" /NCGR_SAMPLE_ID=MMETSP0890 /ASSEMBLY_ACC=CAM_ASM_000533 /LENGTH=154 /DNA_ID=CAMNT_0042775775 /DNA_START=1 /DNA_END=465 /DNA_ORIENTATION=+
MTELARPQEEVYEENVTANELEFDSTIGALEEILMGEAFSALQTSFFKDHASIFEDSDENKHEYFDIFQKYSQTMEKFIIDGLSEKVEHFSIDKFSQLLVSRKDEFPGDVLDLIMGLSDFTEFKQMMVAFKAGEKLDFLVQSSTNIEKEHTAHK